MSQADASRAIQALNGHELGGRQLRVNEAQDKPRGGGGGGGGRGGEDVLLNIFQEERRPNSRRFAAAGAIPRAILDVSGRISAAPTAYAGTVYLIRLA